MSKILERIYKINILSAMIMIVIGVTLIIFPDAMISIISFIIGGLIIIKALESLIRNRKNEYKVTFNIMLIIFGLIFILEYDFFASILPFIAGFIITMSSLNKISLAFEMKKYNKNWVISLLFAILGTILGLILIFNPFDGAVLIVQIIGVYIAIYGINDLYAGKVIQEKVIKADVIEKKVKIIDAD